MIGTRPRKVARATDEPRAGIAALQARMQAQQAALAAQQRELVALRAGVAALRAGSEPSTTAGRAAPPATSPRTSRRGLLKRLAASAAGAAVAAGTLGTARPDRAAADADVTVLGASTNQVGSTPVETLSHVPPCPPTCSRASWSNRMLWKKGRLLIKYEASNPTGSFKDRGSSLEITKALEFGKCKVALASTGNMGASVAAYAAYAGLECRVFIPAGIVGKEKITQMKAYGAKTIMVDGDYSVAIKEAEDYVVSNDDSFLTGDYPWRSEGTKTVGFEIADQLYWRVPDHGASMRRSGSLCSWE